MTSGISRCCCCFINSFLHTNYINLSRKWMVFSYFIHKITHFCMVSISRQLNLKHLCKFLQDFFAYFYLNCIRSMNETISCTFSSFIACAMKLKSTFKANGMFEHKNSISQHNLFWIFSRKTYFDCNLFGASWNKIKYNINLD